MESLTGYYVQHLKPSNISSSECHMLPHGCCAAVSFYLRVLTSGSSCSSRLSKAVNLFIVGLRRNMLNNTIWKSRQTGLQLHRASSPECASFTFLHLRTRPMRQKTHAQEPGLSCIKHMRENIRSKGHHVHNDPYTSTTGKNINCKTFSVSMQLEYFFLCID